MNMTKFKWFLLIFFLVIYIIGLGYIDYITGPYISFAFFYLIPIALFAWFLPKRFIIIPLILSTIERFYADVISPYKYMHPLFPYWNIFWEIAAFVLVVVLLFKLKAKEERLNKSETYFRLLAENAPESIFIQCQKQFVYVNSASLGLFGAKSKDQLIGHPIFERIHPEYHVVVTERVQLVNEKRESAPLIEEKYIKFDGSVIDVEVSAVSFEHQGHNAALVFVRDITERKRNEEKLRQLSRAVEQSPACIVITDREGHILYVNPKFTQLTGYSSEEVIGKNPRFLKSGKQSVEFYKELWGAILAGKEWRGEFHNKKKNGELYWELASISSIQDAAGHATYLIAVKEDITERKRLENELLLANDRLKELDKRKSAFVANVSHELKNPLAIIRESMALILDEAIGEVNPKQKEILEMGKRGTDRLIRLVSDLLDLAKIEAGKMELKREEIDLRVLVEEVLKNYEREISKKQLFLQKEIQSSTGLSWGDHDKLAEVIINLLSNAIKYTPKGGNIVVKLEGNEKEIRFEIADTGPGIPEDYQEKVFDKFTRIIVEKQEGTGLGLPIAKEIIELHEGKMWIENKMGKGSRFIFTIPRDFRA